MVCDFYRVSHKKVSFRKKWYNTYIFGPNLGSKDSFGKFRIWGFQNCPYLIKLMEKCLRYWLSKLPTLSKELKYNSKPKYVNDIHQQKKMISNIAKCHVRPSYGQNINYSHIWGPKSSDILIKNPKGDFFVGHPVLSNNKQMTKA